MIFALLAPYQILEVCLWQGKSESDIHGTYFFLKFQKSAKKLSSITLEILAPTVTYFKKNTFGAKTLLEARRPTPRLRRMKKSKK